MTTLIDLPVRVHGAGLEPAEIAEAARTLRGELLALDVHEVRQATGGPPPPGTRAGEIVTIGALIISLGPAAIAAVGDVIAAWLTRQRRDVEVTIGDSTWKGPVTRDQREALLAAFLQQTAR